MIPRFTGGNAERNEDSRTKSYPGAQGHHSLSARKCQPAKQNATRPMRIPVEIEWENQMPFKLGPILGVRAAALLFGLILWLWIIPTMDAEEESTKGMFT